MGGGVVGDPRRRPRHMARNIGADYISPPISHAAAAAVQICISFEISRRSDERENVSIPRPGRRSCQMPIRFGHKMRVREEEDSFPRFNGLVRLMEDGEKSLNSPPLNSPAAIKSLQRTNERRRRNYYNDYQGSAKARQRVANLERMPAHFLNQLWLCLSSRGDFKKIGLSVG